jgi:uncharacterized protein YigA (DUF484 family)
MAKLFKKDNFDDIMNAVEAKNQTDFNTACAKAGLVQKEQTWLWNYLSNYDEGLRKALDDAAGSGW